MTAIGNRHRDQERDQRGHPPMEPMLHRPDERNDEERERQRREHSARLIGGHRNRHRGDERDRGLERRVRRHRIHSSQVINRASRP